MIGDVERRLKRGIEAAQAGEKERARDILLHVIELNQRNEQAWLWLSRVVETTADEIVCLENVLTINPGNTEAAVELEELRRQPAGPFAPSSALPRLTGHQESAERVCPRCGYRNPGWAYLCDQCGANLRPVDLREALGAASRPRRRNAITLLEAWGGAFTFNRLWAFLPEIELASWKRSLAALGMAALFASVWRAIMTAVMRQLLVGKCDPASQLIGGAILCAMETPVLTLLLTLACVPIALLTWLGALLVGGRQGFKTHTHLTAVVLSAWVVLTALLAPLIALVPYVLGNESRFWLLFEGTLVFTSLVVGVVGLTWLTQAIQTAHHLSAIRAILITPLVPALGTALVLDLDLFSNEQFIKLVTMLAIFFLPWPGLGV